jgi:hypothetical protein
MMRSRTEVPMRRFFIVVTVVAIGAAGPGAARLLAQKQQQLFVSLVDGNGAPVTDLVESDVMVMEDGVECKIVRFEPIDWPTTLTVLVDNGQAVTTPITNLRAGLHSLFDQLPDGMEVSLLTTAPNPRWIVKPTADRQKLLAGIDLITPDSGVGAFFDSLAEAASRFDKDKAPQFPIILSIASDFGRQTVLDRDFQKLQQNILKHAATVHVVMMAAGGERVGSVAGGAQTEIGITVTKLSGGRYENINSNNRLTTLLPELATRIRDSSKRQAHEYRVTYERPSNPKPMPQISASIARNGATVLTVDGHIP